MRPELKEIITSLGLEYRLMTQFTSFVAVEEMIVTDGGTPRRIDVRVDVPEGVSRAGVFGGDQQQYVSQGLVANAMLVPKAGLTVNAVSELKVTSSGSGSKSKRDRVRKEGGGGAGGGGVGGGAGGVASTSSAPAPTPPPPSRVVAVDEWLHLRSCLPTKRNTCY